MKKLEKRIIHLESEELDNLERKLYIKSSKLAPGKHRSIVRGTQEEDITIPEKNELEESCEEIATTYKNGIEIAPHVESLPLIPLFEAKGIELPGELQVESKIKHYKFYQADIICSMIFEKGVFPLSAELGVTIDDDSTDKVRKTRPIKLFPDRKDITRFSVDVEGSVGIDAGMNFTVPTGPEGIIPFANVHAELDANTKASIVAGPFNYQFKQAAVEVIGTGTDHPYWRYNLKSELSGMNEFKSTLILKVAEQTTKVNFTINFSVIPCKRKWLAFDDALPKLTDEISASIEI